MSDKFSFMKQLLDKSTMILSKYGLMFRSSMMNKPKTLADSVTERLNNPEVVLPLGPTHLQSLDASSKS